LIGHFSAEELASYRAGAIDADRAARISAHLADCARCAGVDSDLAGVTALLAEVPVPPMPDRLTERVQAAIAAESQRRAAGLDAARAGEALTGSTSLDADLAGSPDGVPPQGGRRSPVPLRARSRRRRTRARRSIWTSPLVLGGLAATGVFAVVVIGAAVALSHGTLGPESTAGSQPANSRPLPAPKQPVGGPARQSNNAVGLPSAVQVTYGTASGRARSALVYASGRNFTRANVAASVRSTVSREGMFGTILNGPGSTPSPQTPPTHEHSQSRGTAPAAPEVGGIRVGQIAGCLSAAAISNGVLVVEIAHYQGKPAMIIVSKLIGKSYRVTVLGLRCSASQADVIARITVPKAR